LPNRIVTTASDVLLTAADCRFEELARSALNGARPERLGALEAAAEIVNGPFLQDSDLAWVEERRQQLEVLWEDVLVELSHELIEARRLADAERYCRLLICQNPYNEDPYRLLIGIESERGAVSACMAVYRQAVAALDELGLSPGERTRDVLRHAIG
jgi:DNA-binding SARP family transcriptional activator